MSLLPPDETRPLLGRQLLWLRNSPAVQKAILRCEALGAQTLLSPVSELVDAPTGEVLDRFLGRLDHYDWLILTSQEGVARLVKRVREMGLVVPARLTIAAVGAKTADALKSSHMRVDVVPDQDYSQEGLIAVIARLGNLTGQSVLLPMAERARRELGDYLESQGAQVDRVVLYTSQSRPIEPEVLERLRLGLIDAIFYTASSSVEYFVNQLPPPQAYTAKRTWAISIGPQTTETLKKFGMERIAESAWASIDAMVDQAVATFWP